MFCLLPRLRLFLFLQCLVLSAAHAADAQFAVASAHPLATQAGIDILQQGGNAFDAAVAVSATLAVVEPYGSGIGGGGFYLLHHAATKRDVMLDARETAPLAASRDMYLDANGEVIAGASVDGAMAAGIPGVPAALQHLSDNYGQLPLSVSLQAAIHHARQGFEVESHYRRMAGFRLQALRASKQAAEIFLHDNEVPADGALIRQPQLAATLEQIAARGAKAFYQGSIAEQLVSSVKDNGGLWSMQDLSRYRVIERQPLIVEYRDMKLVLASPPSSGGVALAQMFNMLSRFELESMPRELRLHLLVEAMRRAYRDRAEYLGDPDYVDIPLQRLMSERYAGQLAASISLDKATPSATLKAVADPAGAGSDTTHFSIIDAEGNRVAATLSINYPFGSGFVAGNTGVLLNDEMDDFSAKPGVPNVYGLVGAEANAIEPGKRMLSSMTPVFIETDTRTAVLGTPGGSRIITMVLLAALDFFEGAGAEHMVQLGRFHHQYLPDKIFFEAGALDADTELGLLERGHQLEKLDGSYGNMHVIIHNKADGSLEAASDPRGLGKSQVAVSAED